MDDKGYVVDTAYATQTPLLRSRPWSPQLLGLLLADGSQLSCPTATPHLTSELPPAESPHAPQVQPYPMAGLCVRVQELSPVSLHRTALKFRPSFRAPSVIS